MTTPEIVDYPIDEFLIERANPAGLPEALGCEEDRPYLLRGIRQWQLGGGPDGFNRDAATAAEIEAPGSVVNSGVPLHVSGAKMASLLMSYGIQGLMHERCAAYGSALQIRQLIISQPDEVHAQTKLMGYDVTDLFMEQAVEASERIVNAAIIRPIEESDKDLLGGAKTPEGTVEPVVRLQIVPGDHKASDMVIDWGTDALFDTRKAYDRGFPAYFIGLGILEQVHHAMRRDLSFTSESIVASAVVRQAAISMALPKPDGFPIRIHVRQGN